MAQPVALEAQLVHVELPPRQLGVLTGGRDGAEAQAETAGGTLTAAAEAEAAAAA